MEELFFYARCFAFDGQFDAIRTDANEVTFVKVAHGLLEYFLAHAKHGIDFFGGRFVVVGRESFFGEFEVLEEACGEITDEDFSLPSDGFLELFYLAGADNAVGLVIDVAIDLVAFASLHAHFLFTKRTEEIFHQTPVEVGSIFVHPCAFEVGELSHLDEWMLSGSDEAFILVEIKEHVKDVTYFCTLGHIAFR